MISYKLARWLTGILICIDIIHSLFRVIWGHSGYDAFVLLFASALWITVYFALYCYFNAFKTNKWIQGGLIVLMVVQAITCVLVLWQIYRVTSFKHILYFVSFSLTGVQILTLMVIGVNMVKEKESHAVRYLGYALCMQGIVTFVLFLLSRYFDALLMKKTTMAMMANVFSILIDVSEIFVLIYIFMVYADDDYDYDDEIDTKHNDE